MENFYRGNEEREFYVWIDPKNHLVFHNMVTNGFFAFESSGSKIPFLKNPNHEGDMSPFHSGIVKNYIIEHQIEEIRQVNYKLYPSRLEAMYLLCNLDDANLYRDNRLSHVAGRVLKRGITKGEYKYSYHDSSWIEFLRKDHVVDVDELNKVVGSYWRGEKTQGIIFEGPGPKWERINYEIHSVPEVLFIGRIVFPNNNPDISDV